MRKLYLLFLGIILMFTFTSCDKGLITGTITYSVAEHAIPRVDYYAEVYLTRLNVDTVKRYLDIVHLQYDINKASKYLDYVYNQKDLDSLKQHIVQKQREIEQLMPDSIELKKLERKAFESLQRIKSDGSNTVMYQADETGTYHGKLRAGTYQVIMISEGAKRNNVLERRGQILITETKIIKDERVEINNTFLP